MITKLPSQPITIKSSQTEMLEQLKKYADTNKCVQCPFCSEAVLDVENKRFTIQCSMISGKCPEFKPKSLGITYSVNGMWISEPDQNSVQVDYLST